LIIFKEYDLAEVFQILENTFKQVINTLCWETEIPSLWCSGNLWFHYRLINTRLTNYTPPHYPLPMEFLLSHPQFPLPAGIQLPLLQPCFQNTGPLGYSSGPTPKIPLMTTSTPFPRAHLCHCHSTCTFSTAEKEKLILRPTASTSPIKTSNGLIEEIILLGQTYLKLLEFSCKKKISKVMILKGFEWCVGFVDGTKLLIFLKHSYNGKVFFDFEI
ncbi:hypothetical protein VP01_5164g1, partial [Puccinia sorghi]